MDYKDQLTHLREGYQEIIAKDLDEYRRELVSLEMIHKYLPNISSRPLTIPAIFRRTFDENFISDYLAYIIDPSRNGIGNAPLSALLDLANFDTSFLTFDFVEITREFVFSTGERIDLFIQIDSKVVIILENKLFSPEGQLQTVSYARSVRKEFPDLDHCMVFLTPEKRTASSADFQPVGYDELVSAFHKLRLRLGNNLRAFFYWEDFLTHLEVYITMSNRTPKLSEKTKLYLDHYNMIKDLQNSYTEDIKNIFEFLGSAVGEVFREGEWVIDFRSTRNYQQIYKENWNRKTLWVHFEFNLPRDILFADTFAFMVDVEKKDNNRFIDHFEKYYQGSESNYQSNGIKFCPRERKIAIAWKRYSLSTDLEKIHGQFISAVEEFSFLSPLIDEAINSFGV